MVVNRFLPLAVVLLFLLPAFQVGSSFTDCQDDLALDDVTPESCRDEATTLVEHGADCAIDVTTADPDACYDALADFSESADLDGDGLMARWNFGTTTWTPVVSVGNSALIGVVDPMIRDNGVYKPYIGDMVITVREGKYPFLPIFSEACTVTNGECLVAFPVEGLAKEVTLEATVGELATYFGPAAVSLEATTATGQALTNALYAMADSIDESAPIALIPSRPEVRGDGYVNAWMLTLPSNNARYGTTVFDWPEGSFDVQLMHPYALQNGQYQDASGAVEVELIDAYTQELIHSTACNIEFQGSYWGCHAKGFPLQGLGNQNETVLRAVHQEGVSYYNPLTNDVMRLNQPVPGGSKQDWFQQMDATESLLGPGLFVATAMTLAGGDGFVAAWSFDYAFGTGVGTPGIAGQTNAYFPGWGGPIGVMVFDQRVKDQNQVYVPAADPLTIRALDAIDNSIVLAEQSCVPDNGQCVVEFNPRELMRARLVNFVAENPAGQTTQYDSTKWPLVPNANLLTVAFVPWEQAILRDLDGDEELGSGEPVIFNDVFRDYDGGFMAEWSFGTGFYTNSYFTPMPGGVNQPLIAGQQGSDPTVSILRGTERNGGTWDVASGVVTVKAIDARDGQTVVAEQSCVLDSAGECDVTFRPGFIGDASIIFWEAEADNGGVSYYTTEHNVWTRVGVTLASRPPAVYNAYMDAADFRENSAPQVPMIYSRMTPQGDGFYADWYWEPFNPTGPFFQTSNAPAAFSGSGTPMRLGIREPMVGVVPTGQWKAATGGVEITVTSINGTIIEQRVCQIVDEHCFIDFVAPRPPGDLVTLHARHLDSGGTTIYDGYSHQLFAPGRAWALGTGPLTGRYGDGIQGPAMPIYLSDASPIQMGALDGFVADFAWDPGHIDMNQYMGPLAPLIAWDKYDVSTPIGAPELGESKMKVGVLASAINYFDGNDYEHATGEVLIEVKDAVTGENVREGTCTIKLLGPQTNPSGSECFIEIDPIPFPGQAVTIHATHVPTGRTSYFQWNTEPLMTISSQVISPAPAYTYPTDEMEAWGTPSPVVFTSENFPGDGFVAGIDFEHRNGQDVPAMAFDENQDGFIEIVVDHPWYRSGSYKKYDGPMEVIVDGYDAIPCEQWNRRCTAKFPVEWLDSHVNVQGAPADLAIVTARAGDRYSQYNAVTDSWMQIAIEDENQQSFGPALIAEVTDHFEHGFDNAPTPVLFVGWPEPPGISIPEGDGFVTAIELEGSVGGALVAYDENGNNAFEVTVSHPYENDGGYQFYEGLVEVEIDVVAKRNCTITAPSRTCTVSFPFSDFVVTGPTPLVTITDVTVRDVEGRTSIFNQLTSTAKMAMATEEQFVGMTASELAAQIDVLEEEIPQTTPVTFVAESIQRYIPRPDGFVGTYAFSDAAGMFTADPVIVRGAGMKDFHVHARFFYDAGGTYVRYANQDVFFQLVTDGGDLFKTTVTTDADGRVTFAVPFEDLLVGDSNTNFQIIAKGSAYSGYTAANSLLAQAVGSLPTAAGYAIDLHEENGFQPVAIVDPLNTGGDGFFATFAFSDGTAPFSGQPIMVKQPLSRDLYISMRMYEDRGGWYGPYANKPVTLKFWENGNLNIREYHATTDVGGRILISIPYEELAPDHAAQFIIEVEAGNGRSYYNSVASNREVARGSLTYNELEAFDNAEGTARTGDYFTVLDSTGL